MLIAALILLYALIIHASFTVNVFQFGLLLHDNADGEAFAKLTDKNRKRLNSYFGKLKTFNTFVTLTDNFAAILTAALAIIIARQVSGSDDMLYPVEAVAALVLTLFLNFVVAQTLSRRVPNRWIQKTLVKHLNLIGILFTLLRPLVWLVEELAGRYKREQLSEEQKEDMVERAIESLAETAGLDEPLVEEDERKLIGNIFDLDQTALKEIMVPRTEIVGIPANAEFDQIQDIVRESGHSRFPVFEESLDNINGIIYVKDLFVRTPLDRENFDITKHVREPYFVPETKLTADLLEELKLSRNHIAIVVDEYGGTAGLVTMEDLIEVIVGDIQDEHDVEEAEITPLGDGTFRVDANMPMEELAEEVGLEIENGRFETVGGLIYDLVGSLPEEGTVAENEYFVFTVERITGQRIEVVHVRVKDAEETEGEEPLKSD